MKPTQTSLIIREIPSKLPYISALFDSPQKIGGIGGIQKVADGCIELWGWLWINVCG